MLDDRFTLMIIHSSMVMIRLRTRKSVKLCQPTSIYMTNRINHVKILQSWLKKWEQMK